MKYYKVCVRAIAESKPWIVRAQSLSQGRAIAMAHYDGGFYQWTPEKAQVVVMPYKGKHDAPSNRRHYLTLRAIAGRITDCRTVSSARSEYRRLYRCALNDEERELLRDTLRRAISKILWRKRGSR